MVCDHCGAQFSKDDALETHRQTHTGKFLLSVLPRFPYVLLSVDHHKVDLL